MQAPSDDHGDYHDEKVTHNNDDEATMGVVTATATRTHNEDTAMTSDSTQPPVTTVAVMGRGDG
jgi:hypothetical protein